MKKRLLSLCLAFVMVLAMLPVSALATVDMTASSTNYLNKHTLTFNVSSGNATACTSTITTPGGGMGAGAGTVTIKLSGVSNGDNITVSAAISGTGMSGGKLEQSSVDITVGESGTFKVLGSNAPVTDSHLFTWTVTLEADESSGEELPMELEATHTNYNVAFGVTGATVKSAEISSTGTTGNDGIIDIVVTDLTDGVTVTVTPTFTPAGGMSLVYATPSSLTLNMGGPGTTVSGTLSIGGRVGNWTGNFASYTVNVTLDANAAVPDMLTVKTDVAAAERFYVKGAEAAALSFGVNHTNNKPISYQWYKNTTKSTELAGEESTGTELTFDNAAAYTTVDIIDSPLGSGSVTTLTMYLQTSFAKVYVDSATQDGNTINIVLQEDTSQSAAIQLSVSGTSLGMPQSHAGNKLTLSNGTGSTEYILTSAGNSITYTINLAVKGAGGGEEEPTGATAIAGATFASYTPSTAEYGTLYYFVVASAEGVEPVISSIATVTVKEPELTIDTQPQSKEYIKNDTAAALTVAATQSENADVTWQWYSYTDSIENAEPINGAISESYTPDTNAEGTTYYYAVATSLDKNGEANLTKATSVAKITVRLPKISFTANLSGSALYLVNAETVVPLTVAATNERDFDITYTWYKNDEATTEGGKIVGTGESFTPAVSEAGEAWYYVIASAEDSTAATSAAYKVTVREMGVEFTKDLSTELIEKYQGETVKLSVNAAPTVPDAVSTEATITYQWYKDEAPIEGATGAEYTVDTNAAGSASYYVVATLTDGAVYTATSNSTPVTINAIPEIVGGTWLGIATGKGMVKSVQFKDAGGAVIEDATAALDGTTIRVTLPYTVGENGKVTAVFDLKQDASGLPFITTKTGASGTSSGRAENNKFTQKDITLSNGSAQFVFYLYDVVPSTTNNPYTTYKLELTVADPVFPPVRIMESDSVTAYTGMENVLDLTKYFSDTDTDTWYLVDGETETPLSGNTYSFTPTAAGTYTYVFAASNDLGGMCDDYVTVTATASDVENGIWIRHITGNGSLDSVAFTDENGNAIDGISIAKDGTTITATLPRETEMGSKVKATFALTQNNGLPFVSGSNAFNQGKGSTTAYTSTISGGVTTKVVYLYNAVPGATSNNYTTYTLKYVIANEAPVLADEQAATGEASITADQTYTLDLDDIFVDPDSSAEDEDRVAKWKVSINGGTSAAATVDENHVYSFSTKEKGEYTLVFTAVDTYNAESAETYTVSLTVDNAATTYDVTVFAPEGLSPSFYWTETAEEGETLEAAQRGNVYTVKVPTNVSVITWRADGMGMSAAVSDGCEPLSLVKPVFTVMAGEDADEKAAVTVTHDSYTVVGKDNDYLLLVGEKYDFTAVPGEDFEQSWKEGKLNDYMLSEADVELELVSKGTVFTFPRFAELTVSEAVYVQGKAPKALTPVKTTPVDFATGTQTANYELTNGKVYEYRVSVPSDNDNCDQYVTYVATFTMRDTLSITVTAEQLEAGDKGRSTIDRNTASNRGRNVGDLYINVNEKGYKTMSVGQEFQLIATRNYFGVCADWLLNRNIYIIEPDFHYSVVGLDGKPSEGVITIGETGKITAVGNGTAIVLVTYDAMTMNHESSLSDGAVSGYPSLPNDFHGAIWPENTGVFVVSVGAGESGISTGMTINEDKATGLKVAGKAIDAEFDVIYFVANNGGKGAYTFKPVTEGVSVSVANPTVGSSMSFNGFSAVAANADGSYSVPLTEGRNIVKLEKDGKAEYQVITAKGVNVTVNGEPLENALVAPGEKVKVEFDKIFSPANRMALYNTSAAVVYTEVSGCNGKFAGNKRGDMGDYVFASNPANRVIENFVSASASGGYGNSSVTLGDALTVPEDFTGEYFTLSNGAFNIGGFTRYKFGDHRDRLGKDPESSGGSDNILLYLGRLPDIAIPVGTVTGISVTNPTKTTYNIGDVFDPAGMEVTVNFTLANGSQSSKTVVGYSYNTTPFATVGEQTVTISYGGMTDTVSVTVTDVTLDKLVVENKPAKEMYYIGDAFDPAGMVITAVYSDESTRVIHDYSYAPKTIARDTTAITVTYGNTTVEVPVTVSLVERIDIIRQPDKTAYTEGERFDSTGMIVKAYYTDGTSVETSEYGYLPAGELKTSDTAITVSYTGDEASPNLQSATVDITVLAKQQGGDEGDDKPTEPEKKSIVAYVSFADQGTIVVEKTPVIIYDDDKDGKFTIGDAFRALHRDFYAYGESGYAEVSNELVTGWVIKFWGGGDSTFSYALNNGWASSTKNQIKDGDYVAAFNGIDDVAFSDMYTWFVKDHYTAMVDESAQFAVKGVNIMGSGPAGDANCVPVGATVTVFNAAGDEVGELETTVGADGKFSITFTETGNYTLELGGTATYGSYIDVPVVPSRCTVSVSKATVSDADKKAAAAVEELIDAIGTVNENSGDAIKAAREAYDKLSERQRKLVSNYNVLEEAEKKFAESFFEFPFTDVAESDYFYASVKWAVINGITTGTTETTFSPKESCTRAQMVTFLWRAAGSPKATATTCAFTDVDKDAYYYEALLWAVESGVTTGTTETTFSPGAYCTRAQMATFLYRSAKSPVVSGTHAFTDVKADAYYKDAVIWAAAEGITTGTTETTFSPSADCTRGQMVTFLYRYLAD